MRKYTNKFSSPSPLLFVSTSEMPEYSVPDFQQHFENISILSSTKNTYISWTIGSCTGLNKKICALQKVSGEDAQETTEIHAFNISLDELALKSDLTCLEYSEELQNIN